jgi:transcriptional regulator with XRE-family HTH domain
MTSRQFIKRFDSLRALRGWNLERGARELGLKYWSVRNYRLGKASPRKRTIARLAALEKGAVSRAESVPRRLCYTCQETAQLLSIGDNSVEGLIAHGLLDSVDIRIPGTLQAKPRVTHKSIERLLSHVNQPTPQQQTLPRKRK